MKQLSEYINEKLVLNKNTFKKPVYNYHPKTKRELKNLISELIDKRDGENDVIDLNDIDTSDMVDMSDLFMYVKLSKSTRIDISKWDISNVKNLAYMFCYSNIIDANIEDWDVSGVKAFLYMFESSSYKKKPKWYIKWERKI